MNWFTAAALHAATETGGQINPTKARPTRNVAEWDSRRETGWFAEARCESLRCWASPWDYGKDPMAYKVDLAEAR